MPVTPGLTIWVMLGRDALPERSTPPSRTFGLHRPSSASAPGLLRRLFVVLALAASIVGATGIATPAAAATRQIAMGGLSAPLNTKSAYDAFVKLTGRAPAIWAFWVGWGDPLNHDLPKKWLLDYIRSKGSTPLIIWEPVISKNPGSAAFRFDTIARGDHDAYIRSFGRQIKAYGGPVILRFAHEFEGYWFPWRIGLAGNTRVTFTAAWRHIWDIYRGPEQAAPNARFLWSPSGCDCADKLTPLWPGDQYVDYIGMSVYNWASLHHTSWKSMAKLVSARMSGIARLPRRPVIVSETGSTHYGGNKATWIKEGYNALYYKWPRIVGVLYMNVDMGTQGVDGHREDWRLKLPSNGSALSAYRSLLRQTKFRGHLG
jgi:hypothetical protein